MFNYWSTEIKAKYMIKENLSNLLNKKLGLNNDFVICWGEVQDEKCPLYIHRTALLIFEKDDSRLKLIKAYSFGQDGFNKIYKLIEKIEKENDTNEDMNRELFIKTVKEYSIIK